MTHSIIIILLTHNKYKKKFNIIFSENNPSNKRVVNKNRMKKKRMIDISDNIN